MKLTINEFKLVMDAVNHETYRVAKEAAMCTDEGREFASKYYAGLKQEYKALFYKLVDMLDDFTE